MVALTGVYVRCARVMPGVAGRYMLRCISHED